MEVQKIIEMICREYGISPDEFNSNFKYGSLPEARQLLCIVLKQSGMSNKEICDHTGFSPPRVTISIASAEILWRKLPYFRQKCDLLKKYLLISENKG